MNYLQYRLERLVKVNFGLPLVFWLTMSAAVFGQTFPESPAELGKVEIFDNDPIHFNMDDPTGKARPAVTVLDNGREIRTSAELPRFDQSIRIMAHLTVKPVPKDELSVHDKWDRAGSIRLVSNDRPDLELVKFVTAYGGQTEWSVDVSHLRPLLETSVEIAAFIDTWVSPAWHIDFSLQYLADSSQPTFDWVQPLYQQDSFDRATCADSGLTRDFVIPEGQQRVLLYYLVSGHCTDGRGADEFIKKDNVISVDGRVVFRYQPWRDDCRRFREINPYTKRWSDGYWSSDYSRSGWCPGDVVEPLTLDLTDHLTPGEHEINLMIENIRPRDNNEHLGYWRVSSYLVGVTDR